MRAILIYCFLVVNLAVNAQFTPEVPACPVVDKNVTNATKDLYYRLKSLMGKGILFGHQDDLAYGHDWYRIKDKSDVKDVCGDYPALAGWELGHVEIGSDFNLDSIYFSDMKSYVKAVHRRGSINSFSWHGDNIVTKNTAWDCKQDFVVKSVLPGGENHTGYLQWLDRLATFFSDLKDDKGEEIPVIFRMFHEHTGNWFWWGREQCTPDEYKRLWIMTVEYLRDKKQIHNLLYAYSPSETDNEEMFLERYPGDDYVDIVGFDCYALGKEPEQVKHYKNKMDLNLKIVTDYAAKADKIPIVGETGMESVADPVYFTKILYPVISKYKIVSVLLWRNAWEPALKAHHYYVPFPGHPACDDFREFVNKPDILMSKDISR
jgi:mannan endo-1,4-beta-mannosidase